MLKLGYARTVACARLHLCECLLVLAFGYTINAGASVPENNNPPAVQRPTPHLPDLDAKHNFALGMIETGNDDRAVGAAGEVSRYQLTPAVWHVYSKSTDYGNPDVSLQVARQYWLHLASSFQEKTGRIPDDFDMYVLWNTGFGYYAKKGFSKHRIAPAVQDRAQRFVNLVNRKDEP